MTFLTSEGSTSATRVERKNSLQLRSAARWISRNLPFPSNPPHRKRKKKKEKNHNTYVRIFLRGRLERKERKEEREGATVSIQYDELKAYAYSTPEAEIEMQKRRLNFTADGARSRHRPFEKYDSHGEKKTVNDVDASAKPFSRKKDKHFRIPSAFRLACHTDTPATTGRVFE